jgi:hypothetical protein
MPPIVDLLLGYLLYRSRLVPRLLPLIAFVGAPLLLASDIGIFFGAWDRTGLVAGLTVIPIAAFEFSLGVYLVVKGFKPTSPLMTQPTTDVPSRARVPVPRSGAEQLDERGAEVS